MKKHEIRDQGFSEATHYPKQTKITTIWGISTLLIIAVNLVASAANILKNDNIVLDVFHKIGYEINFFFHTDGATSVIFLILWALICLGVFLMAKKPKRINTSVMKLILIVLTLALIFTFVILIADNYNNDEWKPPFLFGIFDIALNLLIGEFDEFGIVVMLLVFILIYLLMKLLSTLMFCTDKKTIRFMECQYASAVKRSLRGRL